MAKILPISKAREDLTNLVNRASRGLDRYIITVNGYAAAVLLSPNEYDSFRETKEIMADKSLVKAIKTGEDDIKKGRYVSLDQLKQILKVNV